MINRGKLAKTKRRLNPHPKRGYACRWCGSNDHYSMACFSRPKKVIPAESGLYKAKRIRTAKRWYEHNRPNAAGYWECYLQIAENCPVMVDRQTISLEHVRSKVRFPELRFQTFNIKASCAPCNKLKQSWSLEELAETYPRIFAMITTPEWVAYEQELTKLSEEVKQLHTE